MLQSSNKLKSEKENKEKEGRREKGEKHGRGTHLKYHKQETYSGGCRENQSIQKQAVKKLAERTLHVIVVPILDHPKQWSQRQRLPLPEFLTGLRVCERSSMGRLTSMMTCVSNGMRLRPIEGCSSRWVISNWMTSVWSQVLSKHFFLMPAARVRVPGGAPFSQLERREKDDSWKATKTFTIIGQNNETNWSNKFENKLILRGSASETRELFRSQVINGAQRKEDRRREAIGFEIPLTRGAFDQGEGSTDDTEYHIIINNTGRKVLWNTGHNVQMPGSWRAQAT